MKLLALVLYRVNFWLLGKIVKPSDVEYVSNGCRFLYYDLRWSIEDGRLVGRLVARTVKP
jgi:hypothetical protein